VAEEGDRIQSWLIVEKLGQGGMGSVWLARHEGTGEIVAVKILSSSLGSAIRRFEREARILAHLDHPGIVKFLGWSTEPPALVMERVVGRSLLDHMGGKPLPVAEALDYTRQIAETLVYVHARGVFHRDVKPANVILRAGNWLTLVDFGISAFDGASRITQQGTVSGTLAYIPPEVFHATGDPDPTRWDVYSLGVTLHELLRGAPPFAGPPSATPIAQQLNLLKSKSETAFLDPGDGFDAPIRDLVRRMTARRPEEACRSMPEVARTIQQILGQTPVYQGSLAPPVERPVDDAATTDWPGLPAPRGGAGGWGTGSLMSVDPEPLTPPPDGQAGGAKLTLAPPVPSSPRRPAPALPPLPRPAAGRPALPPLPPPAEAIPAPAPPAPPPVDGPAGEVKPAPAPAATPEPKRLRPLFLVALLGLLCVGAASAWWMRPDVEPTEPSEAGADGAGANEAGTHGVGTNEAGVNGVGAAGLGPNGVGSTGTGSASVGSTTPSSAQALVPPPRTPGAATAPPTTPEPLVAPPVTSSGTAAPAVASSASHAVTRAEYAAFLASHPGWKPGGSDTVGNVDASYLKDWPADLSTSGNSGTAVVYVSGLAAQAYCASHGGLATTIAAPTTWSRSSTQPLNEWRASDGKIVVLSSAGVASTIVKPASTSANRGFRCAR